MAFRSNRGIFMSMESLRVEIRKRRKQDAQRSLDNGILTAFFLLWMGKKRKNWVIFFSRKRAEAVVARRDDR